MNDPKQKHTCFLCEAEPAEDEHFLCAPCQAKSAGTRIKDVLHIRRQIKAGTYETSSRLYHTMRLMHERGVL